MINMAKLNNDWWNAFRGCFETEEDVIEFIFENININGWETSYIDAVGYGEPNEMFKQTPQDKKNLLYDFMINLIN
jgi:hypothetical protein